MIETFSPAKINLYLHIHGKRQDGFHELETLMVPLSIGDRMSFEEAPEGIELVIEGADLDAGPSNLVWKAAEAIRREAGMDSGVRIQLHKKLPLGGGLAGGSSNAAATLLACNELWGAHLDRATLHRLAAGMGSDVNFFLEPGAATCRGRGEIIEPIDIELPRRILLLNPGFEVPTPWAFQTYAGMDEGGKRGVEGITIAEGITLRNDLEPAVMSKYLWIAEAVDYLASLSGILDARMSGSGASVFALLEPGADEGDLLERTREWAGEGCWIELADPFFSS
jgi:4-diphosphocytidyl-2-C-methyl-D-erythritol kinase